MMHFGVPSDDQILEDINNFPVLEKNNVYINYGSFYIDRYENLFTLHKDYVKSFSGSIDRK